MGVIVSSAVAMSLQLRILVEPLSSTTNTVSNVLRNAYGSFSLATLDTGSTNWAGAGPGVYAGGAVYLEANGLGLRCCWARRSLSELTFHEHRLIHRRIWYIRALRQLLLETFEHREPLCWLSRIATHDSLCVSRQKCGPTLVLVRDLSVVGRRCEGVFCNFESRHCSSRWDQVCVSKSSSFEEKLHSRLHQTPPYHPAV